MLPRLPSIGVGVVASALAKPRPHQHLSRELPDPGGSLPCPGVSLPQENPLCAETCYSTVDWTSSGAAPLSN